MDAYIIETRQVTKRFADLIAVDAVDLGVEPGQVFGFLGPNGAGKSTMVRMLTTILSPTSGTARVAGHDVGAEGGAVRARIGVALQDVGLDGLMTARESLVLQARLFGAGSRAAREKAASLLETVGLAGVAGKRVREFSGGMRRRLDLALALVHDPGVLFLDEPTTGLDPISRAAIWEEVRRLNTEQGVTIFLTTQYLEEADRLADEVAIINKGRIVAQGSPAALKREIGEEAVAITLATPELVRQAEAELAQLTAQRQHSGRQLVLYFQAAAGVVPDVVRRLDAAGIALQGLELSRPTLDDVFLRATGARLRVKDDQDGEAGAEAAGEGEGGGDGDGVGACLREPGAPAPAGGAS